MRPTILVVDDEENIRDVVQYALERDGFRVLAAGDGERALALLAEAAVDLVVLDVLMPELDGISVCRRLRERGDRTPIIFLSSRAEEVDRILGLELGGDDYVAKPFSPRELATRVRTVLRRAAPPAEVAAPAGPSANAGADALVLRHGSLRLDVARHEVRVGPAKVDLTVTEFQVLRALLERPGIVYTRAQLIDRAYSDGYHITERTIDTHVRRIRGKLRAHGVDPVETVHGLGYKASEPGLGAAPGS